MVRNNLDRFVEIIIMDNGAGMDPHTLDNLFEKYYSKAKSGSAKRTGSGLGMTIANSLIAAHGGKIAVTSEVTKGSTFLVTLPAWHGQEIK